MTRLEMLKQEVKQNKSSLLTFKIEMGGLMHEVTNGLNLGNNLEELGKLEHLCEILTKLIDAQECQIIDEEIESGIRKENPDETFSSAQNYGMTLSKRSVG